MRRTYHKESTPQVIEEVPELKTGNIRVLILGGVSEIGRNMVAIEYKDDIVIVDAGSMVGESSSPGISTLIPDIEYLRKNQKKIKALVLTKGSINHIGAIPYIFNDIGCPPIYGRRTTNDLVKFMISKTRLNKEVNFVEIEEMKEHKLSGNITLEFFGLFDEIPNAMGLIINTEQGAIVTPGGVRFDSNREEMNKEETKQLDIFKNKNVLLSFGDSINAERQGLAISEVEVMKEVRRLTEETKGRVIVPLFPSQIKRNSAVVLASLKQNRKVYVQGAYLLNSLQLAIEEKILDATEDKLISIDNIDEADKNCAILIEATEGEEYPALESAAENANRYLKIHQGDNIVFHAPLISARSRALQNLKDELSRLGATISSYITSDIRASSHPYVEELKFMHDKIKTKFFIPTQGYRYMLTANAAISKDYGVSEKDVVFTDVGSVVDITDGGTRVRKLRQTLRDASVSIDGGRATVVQDAVIKDRKSLAKDGIFIGIMLVDRRTLTLKKSPDIVSRGFIYLKESQELIQRARLFLKKVSEEKLKKSGEIDILDLKKHISRELQSFLVSETNKQPIVIPVIVIE